MTADANIVKELIDRTADFPKLWNRGFQIPLQGFTANGLFTSSETSDDWKTAHTLLPRGFNQIKIKSFLRHRFLPRLGPLSVSGPTSKLVTRWNM